MSTLYISQEGSYVRKEGERIKVLRQDIVLIDIPMIKVEQLVLFGPIQISTQALLSLLEKGVDVCFLTKYGAFRGKIQPKYSKNSIIRKAQYEAYFDLCKKTKLAKSFVYGKLANMRTLLRRIQRQIFSSQIEETCKRITKAINGIKCSNSIDEIRGFEGEGSAAYFRAFKEMIKTEKIKFRGRFKRPPLDPVNSLLSLGYTLLLNDILSACEIVGLDPYIGYLHAHKYGKPALALDLMEEWRPVMIDSLVISLLNKRVIKNDDFIYELGNYCKIKDRARRKFFKSYEDKKRTEIKHPIFKYRTTYWRSIEIGVRVLGKCLTGEIKNYTPFLIK